jgi:hypothetical protein
VISVWSVLNGTKYTDEDVYILRDMVARNLKQSHRFNCLSDRDIPGVNCTIPEENWPGWWAKLLLFHYTTGFNLYFDLDVVIVGPLDELVSRTLSLPANWGQSGHGGCQSSVMSWGVPYWSIPDAFNVDELEAPADGGCGRYRGLWGDQELITDLYGNPGSDRIHEMRGIYSYKYHCLQGPPSDAKVVCFHGEPKPGQVNDPWVIAARSM